MKTSLLPGSEFGRVLIKDPNRPLCRCGRPVERCGKRWWRKQCTRCRKPDLYKGESIETIRRRANARNARIKLAVIKVYGGKCACCKETEIEFLTIDHVGEDGNQHRKASPQMYGVKLYDWLRKQGFPTTYQVLCWNCNLSKHFGKGVCAHKRKLK